MLFYFACNFNKPFWKNHNNAGKKNSVFHPGKYDSSVIIAYNVKFSDSQLMNIDKFTNGKIDLRMRLDSSQIYKIAAILNDTTGGRVADCYDPHHAILFYKNGKIIAYYEFCLECGKAKQSDNLRFPAFCLEKASALAALLESFGVSSYIVSAPAEF